MYSMYPVINNNSDIYRTGGKKVSVWFILSVADTKPDASVWYVCSR